MEREITFEEALDDREPGGGKYAPKPGEGESYAPGDPADPNPQQTRRQHGKTVQEQQREERERLKKERDAAKEQEVAQTAEKPKQDASKSDPARAENVVDALAPDRSPKTWTFGLPPDQLEYVQSELSFISKAKFSALLGRVIDKALSGEDAMSLKSLFETPQGIDQGDWEAIRAGQADMFVQAAAKLMVHSPEFLEDAFVVWFDVPDYELELFKTTIRRTPSEGGMNDADGFAIIETFIDQNWEAIDEIFRERLRHLREKAQATRNQGQS